MREYLLLVLVTLICLSCEKEEDIPSDIPVISFKEFEFRNQNNPSLLDTLKVTFSFVDGGGDIGLRWDEIAPPYHSFYLFYLENGQMTTTQDIYRTDLIKIGDLPTLPSFNCDDYVIRDSLPFQDTVYVQKNEFFYNIFVDLYVKEGNDFELFDLTLGGAYCYINLHGRLPRLENYARSGQRIKVPDLGSGFELLLDGLYKGEITYNLTSRSFRQTFAGKTIKLKLRIVDRKLQSSNEIETSEITFS
ncbi:hypothetical protein [Cesiribacter andamanensis]|uniref:NigD-like protein n=1 Tax=Cesiribacter andamanensis AMV16 TaxID=1279009 RepID=M7N9J1_9BACT|nr:hypothetical protein [Cesiribacter andamanensis]EMR03861.1 hypothetical protein ADICEAN_01010 [Cesiribacter andamanensis AMV16]